jgi:3'-5' exoribonuclease
MKSHFIADLSEGQNVASFFLVREKEIRTSVKTGSSWLHLELTDRTGTISGKMWDNFAVLAATFERDDVVQIRGRVKLYNGQKELTLEQVIPAVERDYVLSDFLPHTKYDVEKLYADLRVAVEGVENPWVKRLLASVVDDPVIVPKLKRAPAAMTMHHAFIGGLLEHVMSMVGLSVAVAAHYRDLDADLLLAGVVLHDIGKIDELRYLRGIEYSTEGRLLGHISMGAALVRKKIDEIPGFPPSLAVLIQHLILSHHGSHEFGSPALPQTCEALALHFLDDMDSKMAGVRSTLEVSPGNTTVKVWSERNPSLRRAMLRSGKFLESDPAHSSADSATCETSPERSSAAKDPASSSSKFNLFDLSEYSPGVDAAPAVKDSSEKG